MNSEDIPPEKYFQSIIEHIGTRQYKIETTRGMLSAAAGEIKNPVERLQFNDSISLFSGYQYTELHVDDSDLPIRVWWTINEMLYNYSTARFELTNILDAADIYTVLYEYLSTLASLAPTLQRDFLNSQLHYVDNYIDAMESFSTGLSKLFKDPKYKKHRDEFMKHRTTTISRMMGFGDTTSGIVSLKTIYNNLKSQISPDASGNTSTQRSNSLGGAPRRLVL